MSRTARMRARTAIIAAVTLVAAGCSVLPRHHARIPLAPPDSTAALAPEADSMRQAKAAADSGTPAVPPVAAASSSERAGGLAAVAGHPGGRETADPAAPGPAASPAMPDSAATLPPVSVELSDTERVRLIDEYERDARVADSLAGEFQASGTGRGQADDLTAMRNLLAMAGDAYRGSDYAAAANLARKARVLAEDAIKARRGER